MFIHTQVCDCPVSGEMSHLGGGWRRQKAELVLFSGIWRSWWSYTMCHRCRWGGSHWQPLPALPCWPWKQEKLWAGSRRRLGGRAPSVWPSAHPLCCQLARSTPAAAPLLGWAAARPAASLGPCSAEVCRWESRCCVLPPIPWGRGSWLVGTSLSPERQGGPACGRVSCEPEGGHLICGCLSPESPAGKLQHSQKTGCCWSSLGSRPWY